ncbi:hypothetical protein N825_15795 [Skermanella stibiiresistens SB22]|uniref:Uncharacterized protein n=1 Tax=Skermanella stibiiresistens SB22 TaxID=1385369 RepID=W9H272_9PROT|nr:hypothetical protein [Skermanella stibiiresistens]EWY37863.1 hypothetical protein N825_15795 [Skermanella stibiiresistens SB22]
MTKTPDITSGALNSTPQKNAEDAERLFGAEDGAEEGVEEGDEAREANLALRKRREGGENALGGSPTSERFGSPD